MSIFSYILLANIGITVLLVFYLIFLKKETFFQLNRIYLLGSLIISYTLPFIQLNWAENLNITQQIKYTVQASPVSIFAGQSTNEAHLTLSQIILFVYFLGVVILSIHLITRLLALKRMMLSANTPLSYSFFKKIHLGSQSIDPLILEHENIHAEQWHSLDIVFMEMVIIFNWFNPAVYFFRKELKNIHEFIADEGALRAEGNKKAYAMLLLSQTFDTPINNLINTFFNQNLLKQRIMMIQKNKSRTSALLKYLLPAPVLMLMLILSSATVSYSGKLPVTSIKIQTDKGPIYSAVEKVPEFPGGVKAFGTFLNHNIKYPVLMKEKKVEGKVLIAFVVEKDGSLSNIKILRDVGYGSGEEAKRVLSLSPKWTPGIEKGKKVRVSYTVPINFTLKG